MDKVIRNIPDDVAASLKNQGERLGLTLEAYIRLKLIEWGRKRKAMVWNNDRQAYVGEWSDGRQFEVDGDVWSEDLRDASKKIQREHPEKSEDQARDEAEREMLDPLTWTEDMYGVSVKSSS